jgi:plastocyanin
MRSSPLGRGRRLGVTLGLALFCVTPAPAEVHEVTQSGFSFSPSPVIVLPGDTVRWVWTAASHTVTSGTGGTDPNAGTLFDAPLNSTSTTFEYVFNTVGTYAYFCRPHEAFNMKGTVIVDAPVDREPSTWSRLKLLFDDPR